MNTSTSYTSTARVLHWAVAGMVVLQFVLANLAENAEDTGSAVRQLALLANHKSVGITILMLVVARLLWRWKNSPPPLPEGMPRWQHTASHISHWSLYGLLIVMPVTGWLMSSASAYSVSWFNLFQLPDFVAPDPDLKEVFEDVHKTLSKILFALAALHFAAAVKHAVIDKDGILQRMSSTISIGLFAVIIALGAWTLGGTSTSLGSSESTPADNSVAAPKPEPSSADESAATPSNIPLWQIDYANSHIKFTGDQAGAEFDGEWQSWTADIRFAAGSLNESSFDVTVQTADVETQDDDRDSTLADPEWFDVVNFPATYYRASKFSVNDDDGFSADGRLIIKGVSSPVVLNFVVENDGDNRVLVGTAELRRLALGVGTGEWEDTTWVSDEVVVNVRVAATLSARGLVIPGSK